MYKTDEEGFEKVVAAAIDSLPHHYVDNMKNVAIVIEDKPNLHQRIKMKLQRNQSLYGLYEGVPLPARGSSYSLVLPDKITIFQEVIESSVNTLEELQTKVKNTVWHEIAHHYGLGHARIHELESKPKTTKQ